MKQILTLLVAVLVAATTFAQTDAQKEEAKRVILGEKKGTTPYPNTGNDRDVILGGGDNRTVYGGSNYPQRYPSTSGTSREQRIYDINREYDAKIYSIRNNRSLSQNEKERIIRQLEIDRRRKIDAINSRYNGDRNYRNNDHDAYKKSKKYKHDNGNHYGWEQGKGNPHSRKS
jgi:hypothetical protein